MLRSPLLPSSERSLSCPESATLPVRPGLSVALFILIAGVFAIIDLANMAAAPMVSAALFCCIVAGIPHGALDVELILHGGTAHSLSRAGILAIYIILAVIAGAIWALSPLAAMFAFLCLSVVHFAEDWKTSASGFLPVGIAASVITAPVIFNSKEMVAAFTSLVGDDQAKLLVNLLILLTPVSLLVTLVAITALLLDNRRDLAIRALLAVAAMLCLKPVIAFTLFFCILHSPRHLAEAYRTALIRKISHPLAIIVVVSFLAAAIAAMIFMVGPALTFSDTLMRTTFVTLSILTVPHMMAPRLARTCATISHRWSFSGCLPTL